VERGLISDPTSRQVENGTRVWSTVSEGDELHFAKLSKLGNCYSVAVSEADDGLDLGQRETLMKKRKDLILPLLLKFQAEAQVRVDQANLQKSIAKLAGAPNNESVHSSDKLYRKLSSLKSYPNVTKLRPDTFWRHLARHAKTNGIIGDAERSAHFYHAIQMDDSLMPWHETHVETIKSQISVEDLEDLFLTQTMSPYWLSERLMDLTMIQYKP
jgi:hypothetical protein